MFETTSTTRTPAPFTAFHGDPKIKQFYLDRLEKHRAADHIIQGTGWERGRGCVIGCTLESYDHQQYERELGVPLVLAHLIDRIFERLPAARAKDFPLQVVAAIRPGADLRLVWHRVMVWVLSDPKHGAINHAKGGSAAAKAIAWVSELHARSADGQKVDIEVWQDARRSAADAYAAAAYAAAATAAVATAYAAAVAADAYAAYAATDAYVAAVAARKKFFTALAEEFLKLLASPLTAQAA